MGVVAATGALFLLPGRDALGFFGIQSRRSMFGIDGIGFSLPGWALQRSTRCWISTLLAGRGPGVQVF